MSNVNNQIAIIIGVNFKRNLDFAEHIAEGVELAKSGNYTVAEVLTMNRDKIDGKYFIGSGKVEEIKSKCIALGVQVVIINHNISSLQERNLERAFNLPVVDRTRLILDIFASRVKTSEGRLQVELAFQTYQLSRLVRRWSHLERQRGGIGIRGGPGETQMELDQRMIANRVQRLKKDLAKVVRERALRRKRRIKSGAFSISIVGYTNAGKSTLFNALTKADAYVENRLFATLDTTSRKLFIPDNSLPHDVIISDTVGFVRDLPHSLVAAFRATLEETIDADLLLHVVDVSNSARDHQIESVNIVLREIGADKTPQLIVYNKVDLLSNGLMPNILYNREHVPSAVYVSAMKHDGLDLLCRAIVDMLQKR